MQLSNALTYDGASGSVREEITAAHRTAWQHIAGPGSYWTGAERVAIAAEARNAEHCALCAARKGAISPNAVSGDHDGLAELPTAAIDAIHRIVTDPGRLSRPWLETLLQDGLTDGSYVELVSVVVFTMSVDDFARALGVKLLPLPLPTGGEPDGYRPSCAQDNGAWVHNIAPGQETGREAHLYGGTRLPVVATALSLVPAALRIPHVLACAMYLDPRRLLNLSRRRTLTRAQMELVAARVSAINECFY